MRGGREGSAVYGDLYISTNDRVFPRTPSWAVIAKQSSSVYVAQGARLDVFSLNFERGPSGDPTPT
jgi:hypothetical protein